MPDYLYADWTLAPRERLLVLYQQAPLSAAGDRLAGGHLAAALDACRRLLALEPWHEAAVLIAMRACVGLDDLAGARRLHLDLAGTLQSELHTTPQPELQAYYRSLTPPQA